MKLAGDGDDQISFSDGIDVAFNALGNLALSHILND
jgi:hypothetical protein